MPRSCPPTCGEILSVNASSVNRCFCVHGGDVIDILPSPTSNKLVLSCSVFSSPPLLSARRPTFSKASTLAPAFAAAGLCFANRRIIFMQLHRSMWQVGGGAGIRHGWIREPTRQHVS